MKVLFLTPPIAGWVTHGDHKAPNQYYAQLAAYIRSKKIAEPIVLDCKALDLSYDQMVEEVKKISPDVVVMGDMLHSSGGLAIIWHFNESARLIKKAVPEIKTAVGGLWYSAFYAQEMKNNPLIDFIMVGEGELTLEDLINNLKDKKKEFKDIDGLVSRDDDGIVNIGPHRGLIPDINVLPMPAYDLFPMDKYVGHTYWKPFCELMTSRGCPGGCSFCYEWSMYDPRFSKTDFVSWRGFSAQRICNEFDLLEKTYGVKVVVIQDDAFNVDRDKVKEFCEEKIKRGNGIKWICLGRADDWANQLDLVPLMAEAGFFMGLVGIEVSSDEELKRLGKGVTIAQIKNTVSTFRENNVATIGTVLIGLEDDDDAAIKKRLEVAESIDPDILALDYAIPVPGSQPWSKAIENGWIDPENIDLKKWDFHHPVVPTKHLTIEDVGRLGGWCMREFYSKPERIHRIMESEYDDLVKLCVKDFMNNIAKFEKASSGQA